MGYFNVEFSILYIGLALYYNKTYYYYYLHLWCNQLLYEYSSNG